MLCMRLRIPYVGRSCIEGIGDCMHCIHNGVYPCAVGMCLSMWGMCEVVSCRTEFLVIGQCS